MAVSGPETLGWSTGVSPNRRAGEGLTQSERSLSLPSGAAATPGTTRRLNAGRGLSHDQPGPATRNVLAETW